MFTDLFIKEKLIPLIGRLEKLLGNQSLQSSEHSAQMIRETLEVARFLQTNPDFSALKKRKDEFLQKLAFIDNAQFTHAPAVFNEQSNELANLWKAFLLSVDVDTDLDTPTRIALAAVSRGRGVKGLLFAVITDTETNQKLYEALATASKLKIDYDELVRRVADNLPAHPTNSDQIDNFLFDYNKAMQNALIEVANMKWYARFSIPMDYRNCTEPFELDTNDINSTGHRVGALKTLLSIESHCNQALQGLGSSSRVTLVWDYCNSKFQEAAAHEASEDFNKFVEEIATKLKTYEQGKHLPLWLKPDKRKVAILNAMYTSIGAISADNSIGVRALTAYTAVIYAIQQHQQLLAGGEQLSPGLMGELLGEFASHALNMFFAADEVNDSKLGEDLEKYAPYSISRRERTLS